MPFLAPLLIGAALGAAATWVYLNSQPEPDVATSETAQEPAVQEIAVSNAADEPSSNDAATKA